MTVSEQGFIRVAALAPPKTAPMAPEIHSVMGRNVYTGRLILSITALTHIHVGSGLTRPDSRGEPVQALARQGAQLIIPGASIKGMVRAIAELVSFSCSPLVRQKACPSRQSGRPHVCPACNLFGFAGGAGSTRSRIRFGDFTLVASPQRALEFISIQQPFEARAGDAQFRKVYRHEMSIRGGTLPLEAVRPQVQFEGYIWFSNLLQHELGHLSFALGLDGSFQHKIGFGKSSGLGSIAIGLKDASYLISPAKEPNLKELASNYGSDHREVREMVQQLRMILKWPGRLPEL